MAGPDVGLYDTDATGLLDALKQVGQGDQPPDLERSILCAIGLADDSGLTEPGRRVFLTRWVTKNEKDALGLLGQALRVLLPVQVVEQELRGLGAVDEDGALHLLQLHRAAGLDLSIDAARKTFRWLNDVRVLAYDRKNKTVRSLAPPEDAPLPGEDRSLAAMVSPNSPLSNVVRLRRILRTLRGTVTWADPHFGRRALEDLVEELDPSSVKVVRILSGEGDGVVNAKSWADFKRFRDELQVRGVATEWRVDTQRDWHDRWLFDDEGGYNMPPINTLYKGDYSEMLPAGKRPPLDGWWKRSTARSQ